MESVPHHLNSSGEAGQVEVEGVQVEGSGVKWSREGNRKKKNENGSRGRKGEEWSKKKGGGEKSGDVSSGSGKNKKWNIWKEDKVEGLGRKD